MLRTWGLVHDAFLVPAVRPASTHDPVAQIFGVGAGLEPR
jgi:hypothetical protein